VRTKQYFSLKGRACRLKWEQNTVLSLSRAHFVLKNVHFDVVFSQSEKMLGTSNNKITNCKVTLFNHELYYFLPTKITNLPPFFAKK